jgi:hypothetical protein
MVRSRDHSPTEPRAVTLPRLDVDLACRSCGYDLRGVAVDGRCPECGTPALASVLDRADHAAARLPPLDRPWLAGAALATCVASLSAGTMLHFAIDLAGHPGRDATLRSVAAGCAITSLVSGLAMAGRFGSRHRRARRVFAIALAGWTAAVLAERLQPSLPAGLVMIATSIAVWTMRPLLEALGQRSVRFRREGPARQRIGTLAIGAAVAGTSGLANALLPSTISTGDSPWIDPLPLLAATVGGLACVGLLYLSANAVLIARSLTDVVIDPDRFIEGQHDRSKRPD